MRLEIPRSYQGTEWLGVTLLLGDGDVLLQGPHIFEQVRSVVSKPFVNREFFKNTLLVNASDFECCTSKHCERLRSECSPFTGFPTA